MLSNWIANFEDANGLSIIPIPESELSQINLRNSMLILIFH